MVKKIVCFFLMAICLVVLFSCAGAYECGLVNTAWPMFVALAVFIALGYVGRIFED